MNDIFKILKPKIKGSFIDGSLQSITDGSVIKADSSIQISISKPFDSSIVNFLIGGNDHRGYHMDNFLDQYIPPINYDIGWRWDQQLGFIITSYGQDINYGFEMRAQQSYRGIIYRAISPSNKKYYGLSLSTLKGRIKKHLSKVKKGNKTRFYDALRKYNLKFKWETVERHENENKNELRKILSKREIYWIKKDKTHLVDRNGFLICEVL